MAIFGVWMWPKSVRECGAEAVISRCRRMGVTDIYFLTKGLSGTASCRSDIVPMDCERDLLGELLEEAHKAGIRVHAWFTSASDIVYKEKHPESGRYHYIKGRDQGLISLADEAYITYMADFTRELCQAYPIDGLHLDYIRYNHNANGWSEKDFENLAAMGANVERVKELVETTWGYHGKTANNSYIFNAYKNGDPDALIIANYRKNNIKELAKHIIDSAKSVNPNLIFSAATMPEGAYEASYADLHYGQNYDVAAELYDYICPMAYSTNYGKADNWVVTLAKNSIDKGNKVVMGIQVFDSATSTRIMAEMENIRKENGVYLAIGHLQRYFPCYRELKKIIDGDKSNDFCHRIVLHGRAVCIARRPKCYECCLKDVCKHYSSKNK